MPVSKMSKKYTLFSTNVKSNVVGKSNSVFKISNLFVRPGYGTLLTVGFATYLYTSIRRSYLS